MTQALELLEAFNAGHSFCPYDKGEEEVVNNLVTKLLFFCVVHKKSVKTLWDGRGQPEGESWM